MSRIATSEPKVAGAIAGRFAVLTENLPPTLPNQNLVLGDCDGDGALDAVLSGVSGPVVWKQIAEATFQALPRALPAGDMSLPNGVLDLEDVDGDGILDLVAVGTSVGIALGHGDCTFAAPVISNVSVCSSMFGPSNISPSDADMDGTRDLWVVCAGPSAPLYLLRGHGDLRFDASAFPAMAIGNQQQQYLPVFGYSGDDVDEDGIPDAAFLSDTSTGWFGWGKAGAAITFDLDTPLTTQLEEINTMSVAPLDVDRDGHTDYFWSGSRLLWNHGARRVEEVSGSSGLAADLCTGVVCPVWSALALDADLDGWMDVLALRLQGQPGLGAGEQPARPALFMNQHDGTFVDLGDAAAPTPLHSKIATCGDLRGDGRLGCLIKGFEGTSLLVNRLDRQGGWLGVRLRGTVSDPEGLGARVGIEGQARPLEQVVSAGTGTWAHNLPGLVLPTGTRPSADLVVKWPSGIEQQVPAVPAMKTSVIVEPAVIKLTRRAAPADSRTTIDVRLEPTLAGAVAATVELRGAGTWAGPATQQGTVSVRTLIAPATPGAATLDVTLDGKLLKVHPVVRFE